MVARTGLFVAPLPGSTPAGTSPTDGRLVLGAVFGVAGGCFSGGAMTASASAMTVAIAAAVWRIPDPTNSGGVYLSPADADSFTFSAGPASGSRIDVLYVRQNNYEAGDANSRLVYGVAAGTAAASPVAPAIPAGALKIGQLTVPTGVSNAAACTLVPSYTGRALVTLQVAVINEAQLPATGDFTGQLALVSQVVIGGSTVAVTERWSGTAWRRWDSDWATYAPPSLTGISIGSGGSATTYFAMRYTGGEVELKWNLVLGTTNGFVNGDINFGLPATSSQAHFYDDLGQVRFIKSGQAPLTGGVGVNNTLAFVRTQTGTTAAEGSASSTSPFTWAAGDACVGRMRYTPA